MNITWTGKQEFLDPTQQKTLDSKIAKVSKLLDGGRKSDKNAHMILHQHKNQHRAEVTLNFLDHQLASEHIDGDQFTAINVAIEKLEKQILKVRDKRRGIKTGPREGWEKGAATDVLTDVDTSRSKVSEAQHVNGRPQVFRVVPGETKPMTAEEALVEIEPNESYLVYVNSTTHRPAVILRRQDGNFDLVEC